MALELRPNPRPGATLEHRVGRSMRLEHALSTACFAPTGHGARQVWSALATVGAYPRGTSYDMMYGKKGERPAADRNIERVPLPTIDPVEGPRGSLPHLWARPNRG